jgi:hypothetical protein
VVKTLGIRNAKPKAHREVLEDYIQHERTPRIETEQEERDAREGKR